MGSGMGGGYIRKAVASSAICEAPCASAVPEEIDRISEYIRLHRLFNALIIFLQLLMLKHLTVTVAECPC